MKLFIGLMSGTSMDGIDAVLIDIKTNRFIAGITHPYSAKANAALQVALEGHQSFEAVSQLNTLLGREFAEAVIVLLKQTKLEADAITAIGSHGQTVCHNANAAIPYTLQLGCAHTIAELTGITVVADFRTRDLVLGGQGAPFAPIFHQELFKFCDFPLAVVNIGGIANLSFMANKEQVIGYDTGPGNCLMDQWIQRHLAKPYDKEGMWAASGVVIEELLQALLADPFFSQSYPKSIGKEYFSLAWLARHVHASYSMEDIQATLLYLTARTIADGVKAQPLQAKQLLICGGGAHNIALLKVLQENLPEIEVQNTQVFAINPDFIEAQMFAWLAEKTLNNTAINLKAITGAKAKAILGAIYPPGIDKGI